MCLNRSRRILPLITIRVVVVVVRSIINGNNCIVVIYISTSRLLYRVINDRQRRRWLLLSRWWNARCWLGRSLTTTTGTTESLLCRPCLIQNGIKIIILLYVYHVTRVKLYVNLFISTIKPNLNVYCAYIIHVHPCFFYYYSSTYSVGSESLKFMSLNQK